MKKHNDLIMELPNFVPESFCKHVIHTFEHDLDNQCTGRMKYHNIILTDKSLKDSVEIYISGYDLSKPTGKTWKDIDETLSKYIGMGVKIYTKYLNDEYPGPDHKENKQKLRTFETLLSPMTKTGLVDNGFSVQRQSRGVKYGWHYDSIPGSYLFGILYLNTMNEDEGGCTEFLNGGRKIRPEVGKIMLSPAEWSYAHCGNEVKCEYKYTIPFMFNYAPQ